MQEKEERKEEGMGGREEERKPETTGEFKIEKIEMEIEKIKHHLALQTKEEKHQKSHRQKYDDDGRKIPLLFLAYLHAA